MGLFRYKRLHMGISSASEIFTETIRVLLEGCRGQLNMADDILIWGTGLEDLVKNLHAVLDVIEANGITLNRDKCEFFKEF